MATRIVYVITKATWGGAQRYVYDLATAALAEGLEVAVAYGSPGLLAERLEEAGVRTLRIPALGRDVRLGKDIAAYRALYRLFRREHPDVVHLNSSKAGFVGALAARLAGVSNIIFTAHGWAFTEDRPFPARMAFRLLHWLTLSLSTKVIAVSAFVAERAPLWGIPKKRMALIRLGIRTTACLPRAEARAELAGIDPSLAHARDALWVGTVAELHHNKGLDIGVAGWQKAALTGAEWVILGAGSDEALLRRASAHLPSIHFLGFVPEAARYMKAFDIFLLPSRTEALGYAILEAGVAGVPVLTSGVGGMREAVGPEYPATGFFEPEDPDSLARALAAATHDKEYLSRAGVHLEAYVRELFSLERMTRETFALYRPR